VNATTAANWLIVTLLLTLAVLMLRWQIRHARTADAERDRILFGSTQQPETPPLSPQPVPAAPDNEPGIHLADHDECELLWAMNARNPGPDRLWAAIRNEQQKGAGDV
jgi:hypothetical protein